MVAQSYPKRFRIFVPLHNHILSFILMEEIQLLYLQSSHPRTGGNKVKGPKSFPYKHFPIYAGRKTPLFYVLLHHIGHKYVTLTSLDEKKVGFFSFCNNRSQNKKRCIQFLGHQFRALSKSHTLQPYFLLAIKFQIKCHLFKKAFSAAYFRVPLYTILYLAMSLRD